VRRLYRITVDEITLVNFTAKRTDSTRDSFGAQLEEGIEGSNGRIRWKKVGGPFVHDDSPEDALMNLAEALKHYGGVDGLREACAAAYAPHGRTEKELRDRSAAAPSSKNRPSSRASKGASSAAASTREEPSS
jgi:hypothetical protein